MINEVALSKAIPEIRANKIQGLEDFYLLTYRIVYSDIKDYVENEEIVWNILADVYVDVWKRAKSMPEATLIRAWLRILIKDTIKQKDGLDNIVFEFDDEITDDKNIENKALSVLIDIEDKLGIIKAETTKEKTSGEIKVSKNIFSILMIIFVAIAGIFVVTSIIDMAFDLGKLADKGKNIIENSQISTIEESLKDETIEKETTVVYGWNDAGDKKKYRQANGDFIKDDFLEDDNKVYYFDKDGFLYTGNLKKDAWIYTFDNNGEMISINIDRKIEQGNNLLKMRFAQYGLEERMEFIISDSIMQDAEWLYYLEILDDKLNLIRFRQEDGYMELLAEGIDGYLILKNNIWYSKDENIESLDKFMKGSKIKNDYSIKEENGKYALYDRYGKKINTESGYMQIGLINYRIENGLIKYIKPAEQSIGNYIFRINEDTPDNAIYLQDGSIYLTEDGTINTLCVVGDYVYYSFSFTDENKKTRSKIKRINTRDREREDVTSTFDGVILNMYYNSNGNIYMEYFPDATETYGEVAVLTSNNKFFSLYDNRNGTGDTMLEIIMINEDGIYCYLDTCKLDTNGTIKILSQKPIKINANQFE